MFVQWLLNVSKPFYESPVMSHYAQKGLNFSVGFGVEQILPQILGLL